MLVHILNIEVLDNPSYFLSPFRLIVTFQCLEPLQDDLEWKVIYVGSAESSSYDQTLEEILVGPVPVGVNKFILEAEAPNPTLIRPQDILGVTVMLVTCSYLGQEFLRVGYYVYNEFMPYEGYNQDDSSHVDNLDTLDLSKIVRRVLSDKPRITRFPIHWSSKSSLVPCECEAEMDEIVSIGNSLHGDFETRNRSISVFTVEEEPSIATGQFLMTSPDRSPSSSIDPTIAVTPDSVAF